MPENLNLEIEGLECAGCALDLETFLLRMDGIIRARANYAGRSLTVEYDPEEMDEKRILAALVGLKLRPAKV